MPRRRNKKNQDKKEQIKQPIEQPARIDTPEIAIPIAQKQKKVEYAPVPDIGEKQLEKLNAVAYSTMEKFLKTNEKIIVVVYEVPAMRLIEGDQWSHWKAGLESALVKQANNRRIKITRDKFKLEALPVGENILLKAYFKIEDAYGGAGVEQHNKTAPPPGKEGLIIEE